MTFQYSVERPHQFSHKTNEQLVVFQITNKEEQALTKPHFVVESDHKFLYVHKQGGFTRAWRRPDLCFGLHWRS